MTRVMSLSDAMDLIRRNNFVQSLIDHQGVSERELSDFLSTVAKQDMLIATELENAMRERISPEMQECSELHSTLQEKAANCHHLFEKYGVGSRRRCFDMAVGATSAKKSCEDGVNYKLARAIVEEIPDAVGGSADGSSISQFDTQHVSMGIEAFMLDDIDRYWKVAVLAAIGAKLCED